MSLKVKLPSFNNPISCLLTSSIQSRLIINQSAYLTYFLEFFPNSKGIKFTYPSCFQISTYLVANNNHPDDFILFRLTTRVPWDFHISNSFIVLQLYFFIFLPLLAILLPFLLRSHREPIWHHPSLQISCHCESASSKINLDHSQNPGFIICHTRLPLV